MNFETIVVHQSMLAESYGAYLWKENRGSEMLMTPALTEMDQTFLEKIKDKRILIVGGYYRENMKPILEAVKEITVFYNSSDADGISDDYNHFISVEFTGFLSWTVEQLKIEEKYILKIAQYLDEYLYGYPSEEALRFQNGLYTIQKENVLDKILTVKSLEDIEATIIKGKEIRIAEQRMKCAK